MTSASHAQLVSTPCNSKHSTRVSKHNNRHTVLGRYLLPGRSVGVDLKHVRSGGIDATQNEGGGNMALITEQHALEHGASRDDPTLDSAHVHPEELELAGNQLRGLLGICRRTGTAAVDVGG